MLSAFCRPGGHSEGILPDPIPNSAVKAFCAHGTAAQAAGESVAARSAKDEEQSRCHNEFEKPRRRKTRGFLFAHLSAKTQTPRSKDRGVFCCPDCRSDFPSPASGR